MIWSVLISTYLMYERDNNIVSTKWVRELQDNALLGNWHGKLFGQRQMDSTRVLGVGMYLYWFLCFLQASGADPRECNTGKMSIGINFNIGDCKKTTILQRAYYHRKANSLTFLWCNSRLVFSIVDLHCPGFLPLISLIKKSISICWEIL